MSQYKSGYAVVIGVGADLPTTVEDANAIAALLQDTSRCAYPANQVQLLTSTTARRENILNSLDRLAEQVKNIPDTTAIIYFSGHGIEDPDYYLLPYDYDENDPSTLISETEFTAKLRAIQAKKLVVLLDCCHAGGQADVKGISLQKSPLTPAILQEFEQSSGRVVITSSRKDEKSYVSTPYSFFTQALLEALAGYGAFEKDGFARILDLALYVNRVVPSRSDGQQHPIIKVSNLEDNFALAYYSAGEKQPKSLDWVKITIPMLTDHTSEQITTWQQILINRREALMLIQERMSEYIEYQEIPLQLIRNERKTKQQIEDLEQKLKIKQI